MFNNETEANGNSEMAYSSVSSAQFKFSSAFNRFNSSSIRLSIIGYLLCLLSFQFTATGVAGLHGLTVTSHVTVGTRQESANAIILNQLSEEKTVRVQRRKRTPVIRTIVQVFIFAAVLIWPIDRGCFKISEITRRNLKSLHTSEAAHRGRSLSRFL